MIRFLLAAAAVGYGVSQLVSTRRQRLDREQHKHDLARWDDDGGAPRYAPAPAKPLRPGMSG